MSGVADEVSWGAEIEARAACFATRAGRGDDVDQRQQRGCAFAATGGFIKGRVLGRPR